MHVPQTGIYALQAGQRVEAAGVAVGAGAGGPVDITLVQHFPADLAWLKGQIRTEVLGNVDAINLRIGEEPDVRRRTGRF